MSQQRDRRHQNRHYCHRECNRGQARIVLGVFGMFLQFVNFF